MSFSGYELVAAGCLASAVGVAFGFMWATLSSEKNERIRQEKDEQKKMWAELIRKMGVQR